MSVPRRSTVYDLASLRLHTDGSRVYQSSSTNLKPRNAKLAVRDVRGNWIARDAGGTARVPRWRNVATTEDGSVELEKSSKSNFVEPGTEERGEKSDEEDNGEGQVQYSLKRKPKKVDGRTTKRRKFVHDHSYIGETPVEASLPGESHFLPLPSSDLLKCIHHFAAKYYSEKGQLLNISREYRAKRKAKRLAKRAKRQAAEGRSSVDNSVSRSPSIHQLRHASPGEDDELDTEDEDGEDEVEKGDSEQDEENEDTPKKGKKRPKRHQAERFRDMYKVFDGSALMAIGMIVQEHVTRLLEPRVPDGWEVCVKAAYPNGVWVDDQEGSEEEP